MPGKYSKQKGYRIEHNFVKLLTEQYQLDAKRIPLSGGSWLKGDIIISYNDKNYVCEVKGGNNRFASIYNIVKKHNLSTFKLNDKYIVTDINTFVNLIKSNFTSIDINTVSNITIPKIKQIDDYIENKNFLIIKQDR